MIDDCYQLALNAIKHHLDQAGVEYQLDDGEILVAGHRLGLAVTFDGFVEQGQQIIAPLDVQIHLDGDEGDRFRMGTLGVGADPTSALNAAVFEWHLLAAAPVLSALGAVVDRRKKQTLPRLAGWDFFPGRAGVRGILPPELEPSSSFYQSLLNVLHNVVSSWPEPPRFELRSICILVSHNQQDREIQAAIDGLVDEKLTANLQSLAWPKSSEAYLYKQLFVFRSLAN
jgi:hypothetical protein